MAVCQNVSSDTPTLTLPPLSADLRSTCRVSTKHSFVHEPGEGGLG